MSSTPSVHVSQHQRLQSPSRYYPSPASASPMAIPRVRHPVPPPLPPPTHIPEISAGHDPGWQWGNDPNGAEFGRAASVKPGSSLLGGGTKSVKRQEKEQDGDAMAQYTFDDSRRGSSISTITGRENDMSDKHQLRSDDDVNSPQSTSNGLTGEKPLEHKALSDASHSYDQQLLRSIGGPNTPSRGSLSHTSEGPLAHAEIERRNSTLRPLTVPDKRHGSLDSASSARWPLSGGISPGYTCFWQDHSYPETSRSAALHRASLTSEDAGSHRGSYDHSMFTHDDFEDNQMSNLNLHDKSPGSPKAGSKRRASSPPQEREDRSSVSSASGHSEAYQRRSMHQLPNRCSPVSRFQPNHSSLSSASSFGPRHGSLGSSLGISSIPSSATSYTSGRLSPVAISSAVDQEVRAAGVPYSAGKPAQASPNLSQHQRTFSESSQNAARKQSTDSAAHSRNGSSSHMQGIFVCECCPKKPKKFDKEEDLRAHESEKQYMCSYCPNRFKNKNEAERHQNSLHLRKVSWACSVISGMEAAFHQSPCNNADVCGYCGEEFSNPPQWDIRADHLNRVHKFGECNQSKKFFRADHFRQHLKHSHQGTSGKWTNMLEIACMKEEPPEEKRMSPVTISASMHSSSSLPVTTSGLTGSGPGQGGPGTIEETPHDS